MTGGERSEGQWRTFLWDSSGMALGQDLVHFRHWSDHDLSLIVIGPIKEIYKNKAYYSGYVGLLNV